MSHSRFKMQLVGYLVALISCLALPLVAQTASSLSGTVINDVNNPIENYPVVLSNLSGETLDEVRTDQSGQFVFTGLVNGSYQIEVEAVFIFVPASATAGSKGSAVQPGTVTGISIDRDEVLDGYQFQVGISTDYTVISGSSYHDVPIERFPYPY